MRVGVETVGLAARHIQVLWKISAAYTQYVS